jgi:hypothetical protein
VILVWPHELKLQRASQHLKELKAEIDRWVEIDGYTIRVEPDPDPSKYTSYEVKAYILRHIEEDPFSLLIGDFLQNARAALDYIAFALGDAGAGGRMPDEIAMNTGFPIVGDVDREGFSGRGPDLFADAARRRLATVAEPARAVIEQLQPYYVGGEAWMWESLWVLHELARFDRHRFLHLAVMRTGEVRLDPATSRNVAIGEIETDYGARVIEDPPWDEDDTTAGAVLARFMAGPANPRKEMQMNFLAELQLGFDIDTLPPTLDVIEGQEIWFTLWRAETDVRRVLDKLKSFLPSRPPN